MGKNGKKRDEHKKTGKKKHSDGKGMSEHVDGPDAEVRESQGVPEATAGDARGGKKDEHGKKSEKHAGDRRSEKDKHGKGAESHVDTEKSKKDKHGKGTKPHADTEKSKKDKHGKGGKKGKRDKADGRAGDTDVIDLLEDGFSPEADLAVPNLAPLAIPAAADLPTSDETRKDEASEMDSQVSGTMPVQSVGQWHHQQGSSETLPEVKHSGYSALRLRTCKSCGATVSKGAKRCPRCGANPRPFFKRAWFWATVACVLVLLYLASCLTGCNKVLNPFPTRGKVATSGFTDLSVGTTAAIGKVDVTVTSITEGPARYDGTPTIRVDVTYRNNSTSQVSYNPYDWRVEEADGTREADTYVPGDSDTLHSGNLATGQTKTGHMYFRNSDAAAVSYTSSMVDTDDRRVTWTVR